MSETNVAIQIKIKKGMYIILDCEATARNDEAVFENPSGSQRELAPLAGSKIYSHRKDTFILSALYIYQ